MSEQKTQTQEFKLHPMARIVLAGLLIIAMVKWLPIVEIMEVFFMVVIIPLVLLSLVGVIGNDTYNMITTQIDKVKEKVKEEVDKATSMETPKPETESTQA
jgi:hypothetical protein